MDAFLISSSSHLGSEHPDDKVIDTHADTCNDRQQN